MVQPSPPVHPLNLAYMQEGLLWVVRHYQTLPLTG